MYCNARILHNDIRYRRLYYGGNVCRRGGFNFMIPTRDVEEPPLRVVNQ